MRVRGVFERKSGIVLSVKRTAGPAVPTPEEIARGTGAATPNGQSRNSAGLLRQGQEIGKDFLSFLSEDRLWVELDTPDGIFFVADAHDLAFGFGFGGDLEGVGNGVAFDDE